MKPDLSKFARRLRSLIEDAETEEFHRLYEDTRFNQLALELFRLQLEANDAYRSFCDHRRILPGSIQHWTEIPALPTATFKDIDVTSLSRVEWKVTFQSSGTTGTDRSRHHHSLESLAVYEGSALTWFRKSVLADEQMRLLSLTPPDEVVPHSSLVHMFETIRNAHGHRGSLFAGRVQAGDSWVVDMPAATGFLRESIADEQPTLILGTAFSFVHLIDHCLEQGHRFRLPSGSQVMETGGYKGRSRSMRREELSALLQQMFDLAPDQIVTEYGMSELSSQAYRRSGEGSMTNQGLFRLPPWARMQVVSPETGRPVAPGQTGLIRIFDLANVWSVMVLQTEDLGIQQESGFELLGRSADVAARGCSLMSA